MSKKSAFPYRDCARKRAVKNRAKCVAKPLKQWVRERKRNTLKYALRAALNVASLVSPRQRRLHTFLEPSKVFKATRPLVKPKMANMIQGIGVHTLCS
jgi:hypothetical protein